MDARQFQGEIIDPTLRAIGLHSTAASELMLGTALVESGLRYLRQLGGGPALSFFQIEPATHDDTVANFLEYRRDHLAWTIVGWGGADAARMIYDMRYACMIARLKYYRDSEPLPAAGDVEGMGRYWKRIYNSAGGAGTPEKFVAAYRGVE